MKAISIHQPWASLLAQNIKLCETRHWKPPKELMGQRIAIHAAKNTRSMKLFSDENHPDHDRRSRAMRMLCGTGNKIELPHGHIVATGIIAYVLDTNGHMANNTISLFEKALGDWSPNRYAWRFIDVQALKVPIPYTGQQGFFNVPSAAFCE